MGNSSKEVTMNTFEKFTEIMGKFQGKENIERLSNYIRTNKKKSMIAGSIAGVLLAGSTLGVVNYQTNAVTLYHVYVDGEEVGTISDASLIEDWENSQLSIAEKKYHTDNLDIKNIITYEKEKVYKGSYDNEDTINQLGNKIKIEAKGVELVVNGKSIGYVNDQATADRILAKMKQQYTPKDEKSKVSAASVNGTQPSTKLEEVSIKEKLDIKEKNISPDKIISEEDMLTLLKKGTLEEKVYQVQEGDTISEIAVKHGLSTKQIYQLNPSLNGEFINIGDEIVVTAMTPLVTVQSKELVSQVERIPYQVEYEKDSSMYSNESKVIKQGQEGTRKVEYAVVKENGVVTQKTIIKEDVIEEAKNKIVKKGTKIASSRGTGSYSWPTVGGIITSPYGSRWGTTHEGIDISGVSNYTVKAADNGKVIFTGWKSGYGKTIIIDHGNNTKTLYAHLSKINVSNGNKVAKGQAIAVMGNTGRSTGTHLHFEVQVNGRVQNPLNYVSK